MGIFAQARITVNVAEPEAPRAVFPEKKAGRACSPTSLKVNQSTLNYWIMLLISES
jgi:hypothetical protein